MLARSRNGRPSQVSPRHAPGVRHMSRMKSGANLAEAATTTINGSAETVGVLAHAEHQFAEELTALAKPTTKPRPPRWKLSPWAVATYLLGGNARRWDRDHAEIHRQSPPDRNRHRHARDRPRVAACSACPGTAKSWVSEHLSAAIRATRPCWCKAPPARAKKRSATAGITPACSPKGPSAKALVPSPLMRAMKEGKIARVEELTRIPADVQDTLITDPLRENLADPRAEFRSSEHSRVQPHCHREQPRQGRQRAFERLEATVQHGRLADARNGRRGSGNRPAPASNRSAAHWSFPAEPPGLEEIRRVVTIFRELRDGQTTDGKVKVKQPTGTMSTAEAISRRRSRARPGRPFRRRRDACRPIWRRDSSAPSSKTRCKTASCGTNTSKPS